MFAALLKKSYFYKIAFWGKKKKTYAKSRRILLGYYIQKLCRLKCR